MIFSFLVAVSVDTSYCSEWSRISMCGGVFHHTLFILVIQLSMKGLHFKPYGVRQKHQGCPTTGVPINGRRERNLVYDTKPLYRFDMEDAEQGYTPGATYQLYVKAQDPNRKFTEVLLSTRTDTESCGAGTFNFDPEVHGQPPNCTGMVYKVTRSQKHSFTFSWTAPLCGCVEFRVRVQSSQNIYYLDDAGTNNGFLSRKICPKDLTTYVTELPVDKRINILCAINQKTSVSALYERPNVLRRRKINFKDMSLLQMEDLKINLHRRSEEVRECCSKDAEEQHECFGDIRRLRINQFCEDGEPIIPFTATRLEYMMQHKEKCCWRLGERRYVCFAESGLEGAQAGHQADWVKSTNILDESDPLNDIEDYPTELNEQLNKLNILPKTLTKATSNIFHKDSVGHKKHHEFVKKNTQSKTQKADESKITKENTESTSVSTTETTEELLRAMQRAQMSYECCNSGKNQASKIKDKDYWKMCEKSARKFSKSRYVKGRSKCRRYYHQCCVEQVHLLESNKDGHEHIVPEHGKQQLKPVTSEAPNVDSVSENQRVDAVTLEPLPGQLGVTERQIQHIQQNDTSEESSEDTSIENNENRDNENGHSDHDNGNKSNSKNGIEGENSGINVGDNDDDSSEVTDVESSDNLSESNINQDISDDDDGDDDDDDGDDGDDDDDISTENDENIRYINGRNHLQTPPVTETILSSSVSIQPSIVTTKTVNVRENKRKRKRQKKGRRKRRKNKNRH